MAKIRGVVVDVAGAGVPKVRVTFSGTDDQDATVVDTGKEGAYLTKTLKAGSYRWEASREGFARASGDLANLPGPGAVRGPSIVLDRAASIAGTILDEQGKPAAGVPIIAVRSDVPVVRHAFSDGAGAYTLRDLTPGGYRLGVQAPAGFSQPPAQNVKVAAGEEVSRVDFVLPRESSAPPPTPTGPSPTGPTGTGPAATMPQGPVAGPTGPALPTGPAPTSPGTPPPAPGQSPVAVFFARLDSADFSLLAKVSEAEAEQAITMFSVASMLLAGKGERQVGAERKTDVLGVLALYYGLQDRSLQIPVKSQQLFAQIDGELKALRDSLDRLGGDVVVVEREAKRQFNLGRSTDVTGNVEFPRLFRRYVEIATDPLLFLDLRKESTSPTSDKEKVAKAFDRLRELKDVVVKLVRSLSKYGTIATARVNVEWADYQGRAMAILRIVASERLAEDDSDEKRPLAVLAALTGKGLDTQIAPYVSLAREGGNLLDLALEGYRSTKEQLENYDERHLLDLFQAEQGTFLTARMRESAVIVRDQTATVWA